MQILLKFILRFSLFIGVSSLFFIFSRQLILAANIYFSPSNGNYIQQCDSEITVVLDTGAQNVNAADVEIYYDVAKLEIIDQDPAVAGVQILKGTALESFAYNLVNTGTGTIKFALGSFLKDFNGVAPLAKIRFKSIGTTANASFNINFTGSGNTLDSNVAEAATSNDILTGVANASATFAPGVCGSLGTPPQITFISPVNNEQNIPANAQISFNLTDPELDIDITSVQIALNGEIYSYNSPNVTYTGNPGQYMFSVTPITPIPQDNISYLTVFARDLNNNQNSKTISFNKFTGIFPTTGPSTTPGPSATPGPHITVVPQPTGLPGILGNPPTVIFVSPQPDGTDIPLDSNISLIINDAEGDIDQSSVKILVNGKVYELNSPGVTFSGDNSSVNITINPDTDFPPGGLSFITVIAKDLKGNLLTKTISFATIKPAGTFTRFDFSEFINKINNSLPDGLLKNLGFFGIIALTLFGLGTYLTIVNLLYTYRHEGIPFGVIIDRKNSFEIGGALVSVFLEEKLIMTEKTSPWGKFFLLPLLHPGKSQSDVAGNPENKKYQLNITYPGYETEKIQLNVKKDANMQVIELHRMQHTLKDMLIRWKNLFLKEYLLLNFLALLLSVLAWLFISSAANLAVLALALLLFILTLHWKLWRSE